MSVQIVKATTDIKLERAAGNIANQSVVHKFGANESIAASSTEDIAHDGSIAFLQSATAVRVAAGNAADTSSGAGARKVMVEGLDQNWASASEELTTNGTSAGSAGSTTFIRVFRAYVTDSGTYGAANTGEITIENSGGGTNLIKIGAGYGQTTSSAYTVPAGKTAYLTRLRVTVDGDKEATMRFFQRQNADDVSAPVSSPRLIHITANLITSQVQPFDSYPSFPAKTDLWWTAQTGGGSGTSASVDYDLILCTD